MTFILPATLNLKNKSNEKSMGLRYNARLFQSYLHSKIEGSLCQTQTLSQMYSS